MHYNNRCQKKIMSEEDSGIQLTRIPTPIPNTEEEEYESHQSSQVSCKNSISSSIKYLQDFFSSHKYIIDASQAIPYAQSIISHLKQFYYFNDIEMKMRKILFALTEMGEDQRVMKYCACSFGYMTDLLYDINPAENKEKVLKQLLDATPYDRESKTMSFQWRLQYAFEEAIFNRDTTLREFTTKFYDSIDPNTKWAQFEGYIDECVKYFTNKYCLNAGLPQIRSFCSRAIFQDYCIEHPLFPKPVVNERFVSQVSKLRKLTGAGFLIREKFMPPGSFNVPVKNCPSLYKRTISECNLLSFAYLPDDLFRIICNVHDFLFEELVRIMFVRAKVKTSLADFRPTVQVGQEDIMPIIILVLVLADIPNLPEIVDFFNEYTMHIQVNSKTGLYMANIATAFGAIMNWEFNDA